MKTLLTLDPDDHWTALGLLAALIDKEDGTGLQMHYDGAEWIVVITFPNTSKTHSGRSPELAVAMEDAATAWRLSE